MLGTASGHLTGKRIPTSCHHEASVGGDVAFQILGGVQGSCTRTWSHQAARKAGTAEEPSAGPEVRAWARERTPSRSWNHCALPIVRPRQENRSPQAGSITASESLTVPSLKLVSHPPAFPSHAIPRGSRHSARGHFTDVSPCVLQLPAQRRRGSAIFVKGKHWAIFAATEFEIKLFNFHWIIKPPRYQT